MDKPEIKKEWVQECFHNKFLKMYDLRPNNKRSYFNASRRDIDDLVAVKSDEEFKNMLPDAVSCVVILNIQGEDKLLLTYEFRYPTNQMLLSVPAGLIDPEDKDKENPLFTTAIREIHEETGLTFKDGDEISIINPLLFSTPGMSDESNGIVRVHLNVNDLNELTQENALGGEVFDGFTLLSKEDAKRIIKQGRDDYGIFYSVFTWMALTCFIMDIK